MLSYAQAYEDVILHRALHHVDYRNGFYIDVVYHPSMDSVTKHFYNYGWRGVNVEPSQELFPQFLIDRPEDINLQLAVTDKPGTITFHTVEGQLGTVDDGVAEQHMSAGFKSSSYSVEAATLVQICEKYAKDEINFLKIDVEGHEAAALRGMDFTRFRPWIMVVEATVPNRSDLPTHREWEGLLMTAGYSFMMSELPNRYYVANEHPELMKSFAVPVDRYSLGRERAHIDHLAGELAVAMRRIARLEAALQAQVEAPATAAGNLQASSGG